MATQKYFVGIDIGTQSISTSMCDEKGLLISEFSIPSNLVIENETTAYEDAELIFDNVLLSVKKVIENSNIDSRQIKAIGVDSQMAGIMAIDEDYNPVGPYDSWIDTRCSKYTKQIESILGRRGLRNSGSQYMHSHISKILWRKHERPEEYQKIAKFIQISAFVSGRLCGLKGNNAYTDYTYIHFNVCSKTKEMVYDNELLEMLDIDVNKLPRIIKPTDVIGNVCEKYQNILGLENVSVIAGCGDTASSSLSAGIVKENIAYDVAGTASVFACGSNIFKPDVKNRTLLYSRSVVDKLYLPLAYITGGGLCIKWFSNVAGKTYEELNKLAKQVKNSESNSLIFVPHFFGRSFPNNDNLTGAFYGLTSSTTIGEMYLAILESIAFEYRRYYDILKNSHSVENLSKIYGVGGGTKSSIFCQTKANILESKYYALENCNSTSLAIAKLAGKGSGYIKKNFNELFKINENECAYYEPYVDKYEKYREKFEYYKRVINALENIKK